MDTSEQYIKMSDTPEIQEQSPYKMYGKADGFVYVPKGNFISQPQREGVVSIGEANFNYGTCDCCELLYHSYGDYIWLPTQSQLQEMIKHCQWKLVYTGSVYIVTIEAFTLLAFDSAEKAFLCAVMKELYHKSWSGEEWIRANSM